MGNPRQRAVGILGLQHQSGRCGSRASGRTSKESIANGARPPPPGGPFHSKPTQKPGGLATARAGSTRRGKSRAASATTRPNVYLKNIIPKFRVLTPRLRVYD